MTPDVRPALVIRGIPFPTDKTYPTLMMDDEVDLLKRVLPQANEMLETHVPAYVIVSFVLDSFGKMYPVREATIMDGLNESHSFYSGVPVKKPGSIVVSARQVNQRFLTGLASEGYVNSIGGYNSVDPRFRMEAFHDQGIGVVVYDADHHFASGSTAVGIEYPNGATNFSTVNGTFANPFGAVSASGYPLREPTAYNAVELLPERTPIEVANYFSNSQIPERGIIIISSKGSEAAVSSATQMVFATLDSGGNGKIKKLVNP